MVTATAQKNETAGTESAASKASRTAPLDFSALPDVAPVEKFDRVIKPVEIPATVQSRYDASKDGGKILAQPLPSKEHASRFVTLLKRCAKQDTNLPEGATEMRVRASVKDTTVTFQVRPFPAPAAAPAAEGKTADAAK